MKVLIDPRLWSSPKLYATAKALGKTRSEAGGYLACLWCYAIEYRIDGDMAGMSDDDIADAAGWKDDPAKFVEVLRGKKWLDGTQIHGWQEHQGKYIDKIMKDRARKLHGSSAELPWKAAHPVAVAVAVAVPVAVPLKKQTQGRKRPMSGEDDPEFCSVFAAYPKGRGSRLEGWKEWQRLRSAHALPPASEILVGIEAWKKSGTWIKEYPRYVLHFERFMKRRSWENPDPPLGGNGHAEPKRSGRYFAGAEQDRHIYDEIDRELGLGAYAGNPKPADVP